MNYKEENLKSYNKHAALYEEKFSSFFDILKRNEFKKFISLLKGKNILDLGCGAGDHSIYFKQQGLNTTCIDISEEMISLCKKKGLNCEVMDLENLTFENDSFDGLWAVTSLLHVPKNKMKEIAVKLSDIIKPEGMLYICVKEGEGESFVTDKHDPTTKRFFSFWNKEELLEKFSDKFELIEFKKIPVQATTFLQFFFRNKKI